VSFTLAVCERAAQEGFVPDIISDGSARSKPTAATTYLIRLSKKATLRTRVAQRTAPPFPKSHMSALLGFEAKGKKAALKIACQRASFSRGGPDEATDRCFECAAPLNKPLVCSCARAARCPATAPSGAKRRRGRTTTRAQVTSWGATPTWRTCGPGAFRRTRASAPPSAWQARAGWIPRRSWTMH
jgi:hypothetical protein